MIYGLKGRIVELTLTSLVIEVRDVFYEVLITNHEVYHQGEEVFIYTYQVFREDNQFLIGFQTLGEKALFSHLISVSGIGPKTALGILAATTPERLEQAIEDEDIKYLKKLPGLGQKGASQIILDLKGKLAKSDTVFTHTNEDEVEMALTSLGFKKADIKRVLKKVNQDNLSSEQLLKLALNEFRS
jgi:Holliday junction DNA helicase RuvA